MSTRKAAAVAMVPAMMVLAFLFTLLYAEVAKADTIEISEDDAALAFSEELQDLGWYGVPGDGCECLYSPDPETWVSPVQLGDLSDAEYVETINSLSDSLRWTLDATGNLAEAPSGYTWAEDNTLVPNSYYQKPSGV